MVPPGAPCLAGKGAPVVRTASLIQPRAPPAAATEGTPDRLTKPKPPCFFLRGDIEGPQAQSLDITTLQTE